MEIKQFSRDQLQDTAKLCRQTMVRDIMPDFLLEEKTFGDPDFDPEITLVAYTKDRTEPAAFIQGVVRNRKEGPMGYVKLLCVTDEHRRQGIATRLYNTIEKKMKSRGAGVIRVYESWPNYFMPGVDPFYTEAVSFFERNKFEKIGDTSNLLSDLQAQDFSTDEDEKRLAKDNIEVKRAEVKDKEKIIKWIKENFTAWIGEVESSLENEPVSLHIAELNGKMKAFSAHEANNKGTGWFGPMGTEPELRGKGVGGVLLKRCLNDMKELGYAQAIIPWVGPIPFYMHYSDARMHRVFWRYEKRLD